MSGWTVSLSVDRVEEEGWGEATRSRLRLSVLRHDGLSWKEGLMLLEDLLLIVGRVELGELIRHGGIDGTRLGIHWIV